MNEKKEVDNRCKFVQPSYLKKKQKKFEKITLNLQKANELNISCSNRFVSLAVYPINVDSSRVAVSNVFEYLFFLSSN